MEKIRICDSLLYDDPGVSLQFAEEALALSTIMEDDSLIAIGLNRVGSAHWSLGDQSLALENIQASLEIAESNNYLALEAKNINNLGNIYSAAGMDPDAITQYKAALPIEKQLARRFRLFALNNNLGKAYSDLAIYDSAWHYLEQAQPFLDSSFVHLHSIFYFNQAEVSFKQGNYSVADSLLSMTLRNASNYNSKRGIVRAKQLQAEILLKQNEPIAALDLASFAHDLALETQVKELIYITARTLSDCYGALNRFDEAYKTRLLYEAYSDSVKDASVINELELLGFHQRQFQMRTLKTEKELNAQLAEQRRMIIYGLAGILIVATILIVLLFRSTIQIREQKKQLEELNLFNSKILAIVSHDIKSPVQSLTSIIDLLSQKVVSSEDLQAFLPDLREKSENLTDVLGSILLWAQGQMKSGELKTTKFLLKDLLLDLEKECKERLDSKDVKVVQNFADSFQLHSNPGILRILLRNLLVNAVKFSDKAASIEIAAYEDSGKQVVEVRDEGVGMTQKQVDEIFSGSLKSTIGTAGEKGNGLGLALCLDFVSKIGGRMEIDSSPGQGSTFRIVLG